MGRPINKRFLGDAAGSIKVSHYRRATGAEVTGQDDTFIISQRSTHKFLVSDTSSAWQEILTLVDKDAGTLANGEFRISAQDADGETFNVTRLHNRTVRVTGPKKVVWNVAAQAEVVSVTGITAGDPAVVTVASTALLTSGDTVTLTGVVGMTEINGVPSKITLINGTSFSMDDIDSTAFTAYVSGGVIEGIGDTGSIDIQAS